MKLKIGVIGVGTIGTAHARSILNGEVEGLELCALCDSEPKRKSDLEAEFSNIPVFSSSDELISSGLVDAVIISTPHYFHPIIAKKALDAGIHVLCEKPLCVYTRGIEELFEIAKKNKLTFAVMLNQRTNKLFSEAKRIIESGEIGEIRRSSWIITNWYRTQPYYNSGSWRATWRGEGGGVLTNQAPHNLDLWYWLCGMPKSVFASCKAGKYHNIEVEDEASIFAEYENGATGVFITTTGDPLGVNRLEISGTRGKILLEDARLVHTVLEYGENDIVSGEFPVKSTERVVLDEEYNGHVRILQNFTNSILYGEKLISPATEALAEVKICNMAYLSEWTGEKITAPLDEALYVEKLQEKISASIQKGEADKKDDRLTETYLKKWSTNW